MSGKEAHLEESYALLDLASQIATKVSDAVASVVSPFSPRSTCQIGLREYVRCNTRPRADRERRC